jgi:hypothetical protein
MRREDIDVSREMQRVLSEEGIKVLLEADRTYPKTIFESFIMAIWQEGIAAHKIGWLHTAFKDHRLAHVGLSEDEAEQQGIVARVGKSPMNSALGTQVTEPRIHESFYRRERRSASLVS